MASDILDTVLIFSLPASGKSETRTYMSSLTPEQCRRDMAMGPTIQLDDYPYVHMMHRIDDELRANGWRYVFYKGPNRPFQNDWTWAVLVELLNEDHDNLMAGRTLAPLSAAQLLMDRLDAAHLKVGMPEEMGEVPYRIRKRVAETLEKEARHELEVLNRTLGADRSGKTLIIEAARGGPNGAAFPLTPPYGYGTTFQWLSPAILAKASVLYVWVDPAESRRKNIARGRPNEQGSILHHCVPMEVMLGQYGCDDMGYLIEQSDKPDTIKIERTLAQGDRFVTKTYYLPVARFDNRTDKTTFVREPQEKWQPADSKAIHEELSRALTTLRRVRDGL